MSHSPVISVNGTGDVVDPVRRTIQEHGNPDNGLRLPEAHIIRTKTAAITFPRLRVTHSENPDVYNGQLHWALIEDQDFGQIVADIETVPNAEALAQLLASAPDLLDALASVHAWSIDSREIDFPHACVEAALRKARGR